MRKFVLLSLVSLLGVTFLSGCGVGTKPSQAVQLEFYGLNDLHGRINDPYDESYPSLSKLNTYFNLKRGINPDIILVNSGDTFQDTYDSYSNFGNCIAECLPAMGFEAMGTGNHEFDWGINKLIANKNLAGDCKFLSANVYHYDEMRQQAKDFASELGDEYKIIERNGVKVGLIGIIGEDQITSITSSNTLGYTFLNPNQIVMDLSDKLKGEKGCDVVAVLSHADIGNLGGDGEGSFASEVTQISPITNERYVDAVFTAHTHQTQNDIVNGVPFVQAGAHGDYVSHIVLEVNKHDVTCLTHEYEKIDYTHYQRDPKIQKIIDKYLTKQHYQEKDTPACNLTYYGEKMYSISRSRGTKMMAKILSWSFDQMADVEKPDVILVNNSRSEIDLKNGGGLTKGLIFDQFPFTNLMYIANVKGRDIIKEASYYSNVAYASSPIEIVASNTYKIATYDFLLFHKNSNKQYDYFSSFTGDYLYKGNTYPCDIVYNYFKQFETVDLGQFLDDSGFHNVSY